MHTASTAHYAKLMEDSLQSRVNEAREALLIAKLNFRRACRSPEADRQFQRNREAVAAKAQKRAMAELLRASMDLKAFIIDGSVPADKAAQHMEEDLPLSTCVGCGAKLPVSCAAIRLCPKCDAAPGPADKSAGEVNNGPPYRKEQIDRAA